MLLKLESRLPTLVRQFTHRSSSFIGRCITHDALAMLCVMDIQHCQHDCVLCSRSAATPRHVARFKQVGNHETLATICWGGFMHSHNLAPVSPIECRQILNNMSRADAGAVCM